MRKLILLFAVFCIALSSCTKDTKSDLPTTYRVDNISDVTISYQRGITTNTSYNVSYVGPIQETVTLSLGGLPAGVTADTNISHTGVPTFYTSFTLTNDGTAKPGTYTITLNCHGSQTGDKHYTFKLKVLGQPQCTSLITGVWSMNTDCNGTNYTDNISLDPAGVSNRVYFTNFSGLGISVYADIDCNSGYITIPSQTVAGHTYSGNGNYTSSNIGYRFQDVSSSGTTFCFDNLNR